LAAAAGITTKLNIIINETLALLKPRSAEHKPLKITVPDGSKIAQITKLNGIGKNQIAHNGGIILVEGFKLIKLRKPGKRRGKLGRKFQLGPSRWRNKVIKRISRKHLFDAENI